jgi:hypothetical protein
MKSVTVGKLSPDDALYVLTWLYARPITKRGKQAWKWSPHKRNRVIFVRDHDALEFKLRFAGYGNYSA